MDSRRIRQVKKPPTFRLDTKELFPDYGSYIDLEKMKKHFQHEGLLSVGAACRIINECRSIIALEPNLMRLSAPIVIIGDIHGQFYDLIRIFEIGGEVKNMRYLFLGDYVDRGNFSVECLLYLCALKIVYRRNIIILRGNHECRRITKHFTFRKECLLKLNNKFYEMSCELFDQMPIAALVNDQFLCLHGCISSELAYVEDINDINRRIEIPHKGILTDLMWSDPSSNAMSSTNDPYESQFSRNTQRGCAFLVSHKALCSFLNRNKLLSIIRGHQVASEGVMMSANNPSTGFPALITVFSAPNYCDVYRNKAAILIYDGLNLEVLIT